jgi:NifU-like protein involved in Fe-S cluster formation
MANVGVGGGKPNGRETHQQVGNGQIGNENIGDRLHFLIKRRENAIELHYIVK